MKYRRLGLSGCRVSVVSLGSWLTFGGRLDDSAARALVHEALELGINFFDTADVYELGRAEEQLGRALQGVPRKDYVLASKVYFPTGPGPNDRGLSRKHVDETVHASLDRLGVDYIDLYQCHRYDAETPLDETVRAFDDLIRQGKILYWGVSCWTGEQIEQAMVVATQLHAHPPITNQPPYSLLNRDVEKEVLPICKRHGVGTLPFSPLAQGVLTGKYLGGAKPDDSRLADARRNRFMGAYTTPEALQKVGRMADLAKQAGMTPAQLAVSWLLTRDTVSSVICGATKVSQVEQNAAAADKQLPEDLVRALADIFPPPPA